ncbi:GIY-YIG nuclease family protein [Neisseria weaveri]|uniref:GIY-YIG nuclease family protein n=1 Tax=Neisseria weaveri TaxID=28091 RepID=UPI000D3067EE|nr:GIY-YIG nuclease family protein [Neisseria weaveri]
MSKPRSQTIRIFLPSGNPRGIRKVERTSNSNIRLIEIPRTDLHLFYEMKEAGDMGIYFLAGGNQLYIGETTDLSTRIKQHDKAKAFWQRAFIVVLNNDFRTLDHLYCLEKTAIEHAQAAGRFSLENGTAGNTHRHLHDSIRSDCENIFDEIDTLLAVLNQDFFTEKQEYNSEVEALLKATAQLEISPVQEKPSKDNINEYSIPNTWTDRTVTVFCRSRDKILRGKGLFNVETKQILLLEGTMIYRKISETFPPGWKEVYQQWLASNFLADSKDPDYYVLQSAQLCASPSMAAALVLGNNRNGWQYWRTERGLTLDETYRKK